MTAPDSPEVAIIGAGPAGLTAAADLARHIPGDVLVLEREQRAGGIPRHSDHTGYGTRDLHRLLRGPAYAARLTARARDAGAHVLTESTVTSVEADRTLHVTTPRGRRSITPRALLLATGARERPRTARLIPGDRPSGVYTTGQLQNLVHLHHRQPGRRAVVVGAELVSWSAVFTLREAGCSTVTMTTSHARSESYWAFRIAGRYGLRVPVAARTRLVGIHGRERVEAVTLRHVATGKEHTVACDTVVLTGDWVPDHELARSAGLALAVGSRSPQVDPALRTVVPGVFAAGNLVHPVDTADVAALGGRHAAATIRRWLAGDVYAWDPVAVDPEPPLRWITPSLWNPAAGAPPRGRLLAWLDEQVHRPVVTVRQAGRQVARTRVPWPAMPGRTFRIPARVLRGLEANGANATVSVE